MNLGVIGWQLVTFGRLMHRIIEAVARQARLMPAEPIAAARAADRRAAHGLTARAARAIPGKQLRERPR